jgi:hypothetical protein
VIPMTEDMRALLAVYADATEPLDWWDVVLAHTRSWGRFRRSKYKQRLQRRDELAAAAMALLRQGLLLELPDGEADRCVITKAGRLVAAGRNVQDDNHKTEGTKQ